MPEVKVIELVDSDRLKRENGLDSGDHIWLEIRFSDDSILNVRIDERDTVHDNRVRVDLKVGHDSGFVRSETVYV